MYSKHAGFVSFGAWAFLVLGLLQAPQVLGAGAQKIDSEGMTIPLPNQTLPAGARIYVAPMNNITGHSETHTASTAKKLLLGKIHSDEQASIQVANLESGEVVFAYSANKSNSAHGKQSSAEACAKNLKEEIEKKKK